MSKSACTVNNGKDIMNLYVCINFLAIIGFLGAHLQAFIKLVDPLKKQQGWVTPLWEGN